MNHGKWRYVVTMQIKQKSKITIVIPVQNMAGKLNNLEQSILSSKNLPIQYLLINDKSTDNTSLELLEFIEKNKESNIELIEVSFGSPGLARNFGLNMATTEFVMFADSDDRFFSHSILKTLDSVARHTEVIIGRFKKNYINLNKSKLINVDQPLHLSLAFDLGLWRMIFRTSSISHTRFQKFRMAEDQLWFIEAEILSKNILLTDEVFYEYFVHNEGSLTSNSHAIQEIHEVLQSFKILVEDRNNKHPAILYTFCSKLWMTAVVNSKSIKHIFILLLKYLKLTFKHPKIFIYSVSLFIFYIKKNVL